MKATPTVRLLTPCEAGERIRSSDDHIYRLIAAGVLHAVDIALPGARRSKTRIREDDLQAYIDGQTRTAG
jgi:excisionase family DNA binding protein